MKSYSITILPDSIRGKHISVTLKGPHILLCAFLCLALITLLAWGAYTFIIAPYDSVQSRSLQALQLRGENESLQQRIQAATSHMDSMDAVLERQMKITDKLYFIFGITDIGGGGYSVNTDDPYTKRLAQLEIIEQRYQRLDQFLTSFDDLPIRMPLQHGLRLTSDFGPRRSPFTASVEMHRGIDLASDEGTPVYAAGGGEVVMAGRWQQYDSSEFSRLGIFVLIRHGDTGYETLYGHCSRVLVKEGDTVKAGQVIAEVGNTGWSTGPHLHFAIIHKQQFVDPKLYLLHFDSGEFFEEIFTGEENLQERSNNVRIQ